MDGFINLHLGLMLCQSLLHWVRDQVVACNLRQTKVQQRYLVKRSLVVEKIGESRKLRQLFLFNDLLVCADQKVSLRYMYLIEHFLPFRSNHNSCSSEVKFHLVETHMCN